METAAKMVHREPWNKGKIVGQAHCGHRSALGDARALLC